MFTAAYVVLVLAHALAPSDQADCLRPAPRRAFGTQRRLVLALCSLLLGLVPWEAYLPIPHDVGSYLLGLGTLFKLLLPVLGGAVLAILLSPWLHPLDVFDGLEGHS